MSGAELTIHGGRTIHEPVPQCAAHSRSGQRCKRRPIKGGTTCTMHGSGTKAAKSAGLARLRAAQDPAIDQLLRLARKGSTDMVKLRASEAILDRTGLPRGIPMPDHTNLEGIDMVRAALAEFVRREGS